MKYTEHAPKLFMNTGTRFPREIIWGIGAVKWACAKANFSLGLLDKDRADAIMRASKELMEGKHDDKIILDVFQTGSGTGLNMNVNEVIAELATSYASVKVHPNDHVNMGQSSNDVVPTTIRVAAVNHIINSLLPSMDKTISIITQNPGNTQIT